jgi:hypothetical protein
MSHFVILRLGSFKPMSESIMRINSFQRLFRWKVLAVSELINWQGTFLGSFLSLEELPRECIVVCFGQWEGLMKAC